MFAINNYISDRYLSFLVQHNSLQYYPDKSSQ